MVLSVTCKRCDQEITGTGEDELVANVQEHVDGHSREHGRDHHVSRAHVLRRLRRSLTAPTLLLSVTSFHSG
jgi:hypothetical protein